MLRMVEAHTRLQQAVSEMNSFRFTATKNIHTTDMDSLSQQLSQIPADLLDGQSPVVPSPDLRRSKRVRVEETPLRRIQPRLPLSALKNRSNVTPAPAKSSVKLPPGKELTCSPTQDEEEPARKRVSSEYGDLIVDQDFSQFDI